MELLHELLREWLVLTTAPLMLVLVIAVAVLVTFLIAHRSHANRIAAMEHQLQFRASQVSARDHLIRDIRPDATAFQLRTNVTLAQEASTLATQLRILAEGVSPGIARAHAVGATAGTSNDALRQPDWQPTIRVTTASGRCY